MGNTILQLPCGLSILMEKEAAALAALAQIFVFMYESTPIYVWNFQFEGQEKSGTRDRI